jgi:hypothetical protein
MEGNDFAIQKTPCSSPLPQLEVPMINTMVRVWESNTES